jgi:rod shape determining protein RodA
MFERRLYFHIDWALVAAIVALCAIGLLMIYSTTFNLTKDATGKQFWTQLYAIGLGTVAFAICLSVDYRALAEHSLLVYGAFIASLLYVMFFGVVQGGARRWIDLGVFNLQPSEFGRVVVALILAMYFGENRRGARATGDLVLGGCSRSSRSSACCSRRSRGRSRSKTTSASASPRSSIRSAIRAAPAISRFRPA